MKLGVSAFEEHATLHVFCCMFSVLEEGERPRTVSFTPTPSVVTYLCGRSTVGSLLYRLQRHIHGGLRGEPGLCSQGWGTHGLCAPHSNAPITATPLHLHFNSLLLCLSLPPLPHAWQSVPLRACACKHRSIHASHVVRAWSHLTHTVPRSPPRLPNTRVQAIKL